jgi:hypothetical protein
MASYALNVQATSDGFVTAATMLCPGSRLITVQVSTAAIYYQLLQGDDGGTKGTGGNWGPEHWLQTGVFTFDKDDFHPFPVCHGVRFRSAVAGKSALVTASG